MKKFALKAAALAITSVFGSTAFAGSFTTPATNAAAVKYAAEAIASGTTALTLAPFTYTMGVARAVGQNFTVILTPSSGSAFVSATCSAATPAIAGAGAGTVTVKRSSTAECAWDVSITTATTTATTLTFTGLQLSAHGLNVPGGSTALTLGLKDPGETSFIDNQSTVSRTVAASVQAVTVYAAATDTGTVADVNATGGPLTGFLVQNDDTATVAKANLTFANNYDVTNAIALGAVGPDGTTVFDFTATAGTASLTIGGNFSGLVANKLCLDVNNNGTLCETGEVLTVAASGTSASLTGIASTRFPAVGTIATRSLSFQADTTTNLGTSRTFAVSGTITPAVGAAESLADAANKNANYWVWSANASQLMTPYLSTNPQYVTRFSLLNTGTTAVAYSAKCFTESGATATNGAGGTLAAGATTVLAAGSVCTFSGAPRGAVLFTINAPVNTVKGVYNIVDAVTGANGFVPLTRPYSAANTTE